MLQHHHSQGKQTTRVPIKMHTKLNHVKSINCCYYLCQMSEVPETMEAKENVYDKVVCRCHISYQL